MTSLTFSEAVMDDVIDEVDYVQSPVEGLDLVEHLVEEVQRQELTVCLENNKVRRMKKALLQISKQHGEI